MLRVKSPQDFGASVVFIVIGVIGVWFGGELNYGSAARMGPGFFPVILSWLVIAVGLVIGLRALALDGPAIERPQMRPILAICAAILLFALLIETIGLALTSAVTILVASLARADTRWRDTLILAFVLSIALVLLFVYALGQAMPPWWGR
ncbi:MAG TPA: tripartite tricarboxylate transporter TctB family protein [Beijerinckiaceae bacterium]